MWGESDSFRTSPKQGQSLVSSDKNFQRPTNCQRLREVEMTPEEMRKRAENRRRAIKMADEAIERIDRALREDEKIVEPARARLRRAGYLR